MAGKLRKLPASVKRSAAKMHATGGAIERFIKGPKKKKKSKMPGGKRAPK